MPTTPCACPHATWQAHHTCEWKTALTVAKAVPQYQRELFQHNLLHILVAHHGGSVEPIVLPVKKSPSESDLVLSDVFPFP